MRYRQGRLFDSYRVHGVASYPGRLIYEKCPPFPFTLLSRTNRNLMIRSLEQLARNPEIKISLKGGADVFKRFTFVEEAMDVDRLFKGERPIKHFKEFESFEEFETYVNDHEVDHHMVLVSLAYAFPGTLAENIQTFNRNVLQRNISDLDADIIMSTIHQAKGLEFDNVMASINIRAFRLALEFMLD